MNNNKKIIVIAFAFIILSLSITVFKIFKDSYAWNSDLPPAKTIANGTKYNMIRKNIYSWHLITHNFNRFSSTNASGTKLIQSSDGKNQAVVYCAREGATLSSSSTRRRYILSNSNVKKSSAVKKTLNKVMPYMYPYITLGELKAALKDKKIGIGSNYSKYSFNSLTAQEATTAAQAALWNIIDGTTGYHQYRGTISSFSGFSSCSDYYNGKVITSEEQAWYKKSGCSSSGNFYKYVYNHSKTSTTEGRIETLIKWYDTTLVGTKEKLLKISNEFELKDAKVTVADDNTLTVVVTFDTNIDKYTITFKDANGKKLSYKKSGNKFTFTGLPENTKKIKASVTSSTTTQANNIYWYIADYGQDFIGLEKTYFSDTLTIKINKQVGDLVIYKVGDSDNTNVTVSKASTYAIDGTKCITKNGSTVGSKISDCLSGAKFILYEEDENKNKVEVDKTELDYKDESTFTFRNLDPGTYYLKETQPALGYDFYKYGVGDVDKDGYIKIVIEAGKTVSVVANNTSTGICFIKVDEDDPTKVLTGASFEIQDIDGTVVETFDINGEKACVNNLQVGTYYIQETKTPLGYSKSNAKYKFTIGNVKPSENIEDEGEWPTLDISGIVTKIFNKRGVTAITKSDATTGACVEGAKLTVKDLEGNIAKDVNGKEATWISECGSGAEHKVSLAPGTYTLTEEIAPSGYATAETIQFTVQEDGTVKEAVDMKDGPINVCIQKIGKDSSDVLEGAEFEIYKEDGTLYDKFTSGSMATCFPYMPVGTYTLKETKAPNGYKIINETTKLIVKDTAEKQLFEIKNEVNAPKTSIGYSQTAVIIASIFMMFGLGLVGYYGYKKQS